MLTDFHQTVLEYAEKNLKLNQTSNCSTEMLDWANVPPNHTRFDIIVGSDICYNAEHPDLLPAVTQALLSDSPDAVFLVAVMKNRPEIRIFEQRMEAQHFKMKFRHEIRFVSRRASNKDTLHYLFGFVR